MNEAIQSEAPGQVCEEPSLPCALELDAVGQLPPRSIKADDDQLFPLMILLYFVSFFAPIAWSGSYYPGGLLFLWGAYLTMSFAVNFGAALGAWMLAVCWLANALFWLGLPLIVNRDRATRLLGGCIGVLAVLAASLWFVPWDLGLLGLHRAFGPAFCLWYGSFLMLAVIGIVRGLSVPESCLRFARNVNNSG